MQSGLGLVHLVLPPPSTLTVLSVRLVSLVSALAPRNWPTAGPRKVIGDPGARVRTNWAIYVGSFQPENPDSRPKVCSGSGENPDKGGGWPAQNPDSHMVIIKDNESQRASSIVPVYLYASPRFLPVYRHARSVEPPIRWVHPLYSLATIQTPTRSDSAINHPEARGPRALNTVHQTKRRALVFEDHQLWVGRRNGRRLTDRHPGSR